MKIPSISVSRWQLNNDGYVYRSDGYVGIQTSAPGGMLGLGDGDTWLGRDPAGNLVLSDATVGERTLLDLVSNSSLTNLENQRWTDSSQQRQDLRDAADGYVSAVDGVVAAQGADGYVAFFTGSNSIAGDNDLYYNRATSSLQLTGGQLILPINNDSANPTLAFGNGGDGFYTAGAGDLRIGIGGGGRYQITSASFTSTQVNGPRMLHENATATNPVWSFASDTDTGLGWAGTDMLSLITGGFEGLRITGTAGGASATVDAYGTIQLQNAGDQLILPQINNTVTPTLAFGDGDTGVSETVDDTLSFCTSGVSRYQLSSVSFRSVSINGASIQNEVPTATNPGHSFRSDTDTGLGTTGNDTLSLITGGFEGLRITGTAGGDSATVDAYGTIQLQNATDQLILPENGNLAAPTIQFGSSNNGGMYFASSALRFLFAGNIRFTMTTSAFTCAATNAPSLVNGSPSATNPKFIFRGDANTGLGQGTADTLSLVTGGFEALRLTGTAGGGSATVDAYGMVQVHTTTGTDKLLLDCMVDTVSKFSVTQSGTGNFAGQVIGVNFLTGGLVRCGSNSYHEWVTRSRMYSGADGDIRLTNSATTDFGLLQLGGITDDFPALKRVGRDIHIRQADDNDYASLACNTIDAYGTVHISEHLGVGTDTPGTTLPPVFNAAAGHRVLEVTSEGTNDAGLFLRRGAATTSGFDIWFDANNGRGYIDNRSIGGAGQGIYFRGNTNASAAALMTLLNDGRVGINLDNLHSATPSAAFRVSGDTIIDSAGVDESEFIILGHDGTDGYIGSGQGNLNVYTESGNMILANFDGSQGVLLDTATTNDELAIRNESDGYISVAVHGEIHSDLPGQLAPSGSDTEINFAEGNSRILNLKNADGDITVALAGGQAGGSYLIKIIQGAGARNVIWPGTVKWEGGVAPIISAGADEVDIVSLWCDGEGDFWCSFLQDLS